MENNLSTEEETAILMTPASPELLAKPKFKAYVTGLCMFVAIVLFLGFNFDTSADSWDKYSRWGHPMLTQIYDGAYWGLISSNFLHTALWHIGFNFYWIWIFGRKIEEIEGSWFIGMLVLGASLMSSMAEITFSNQMGIGLSGIGYALFGYGFIKQKSDTRYEAFLDKSNTNMFLVWLFACIDLTKLNVLNVGNAAHFGGFALGVLIGFLSNKGKVVQIAAATLLIAFVGSGVFWSPYSISWFEHKAYQNHSANNISLAIENYKEVLKREPQNTWAQSNLAIIQYNRLALEGDSLMALQQYEAAQRCYLEMTKLDSTYHITHKEIGSNQNP